MALKQAHHYISEQEYLEGEMHADIRHEYIDGEVFAMPGAHRNHQRISGNVFSALSQHLVGKSCEPFVSDMKVKVDHNYFYPDVLVVCDDEQGNDYYTEKPTLIVEVLSKTTRRMDKTVKLTAYKTIPSLQEYVLIEQDHVEIEVFRRSQNWFAEHYFLGVSIDFEAIGLSISVADLYHRVNNEDMQDYLQQLAQQAG